MHSSRIVIRKTDGDTVGVVGDELINMVRYPVHREIFRYAERVVRDLNEVFKKNQVTLVASIERF